MKTYLKYMAAVLLFWVAVLLLLPVAFMAHAGTPALSGQVVGVADGDTLTVLVDGTQHKVRLAEIDAPEKRQAFGEVSRQSLAALCFGQQAEVLPGKTDFYRRTVARVRCQGIDASLHQVQQGLAWAYTQYLTDAEVASAALLAREAGLGLWVDAAPVAPWLFRKVRKP